jgi:anti-sigma B factor antagonist
MTGWLADHVGRLPRLTASASKLSSRQNLALGVESDDVGRSLRLKKRATTARPAGVVMHQDQLTIETVRGEDSVSLRVTGEIDLSTAPLLREAALCALRHHSTTVDIDLSGVPFMDSTGLEVLLATRRRADLDGGRLRLIAPTSAVMRVIEVTGLDRLFEIDAAAPPMTDPDPLPA